MHYCGLHRRLAIANSVCDSDSDSYDDSYNDGDSDTLSDYELIRCLKSLNFRWGLCVGGIFTHVASHCAAVALVKARCSVPIG